MYVRQIFKGEGACTLEAGAYQSHHPHSLLLYDDEAFGYLTLFSKAEDFSRLPGALVLHHLFSGSPLREGPTISYEAEAPDRHLVCELHP